jgi:hypothetical protein
MPLVAALNGAAQEVKELLDRYGYKNGPYIPAKE